MSELKVYSLSISNARSRYLIASFSLFLSCSNSSQTYTPNGGSGPINIGGTAGTSSKPASTLCEPRGATRPCLCLSGKLEGVQLCDNEGNLEPCSSCPKPKTPETTTGTAGALCADLQNAFGCTVESHQSEQLQANILFVVDRSGSMMCNTPADGQTSEACEAHSIRLDPTKPSKWEITVAALKQVFAGLDKSDAQAGLMFFSNDNYCGVHSDLGLGGVPMDLVDQDHISRLSTALDKQSPQGTTPLVGAVILAYAHLHQEAGGQCPDPPCGAGGNRFVVLITDGVDSCANPGFDNAPCGGSTGLTCIHYLLDKEVDEAYKVNIRTFVIGAPGSELGRGFLSALAFKGGYPQKGGNCSHNDPDGTTGDCHFDMTATKDFAADLSRALLDISGKALGCEYAVPGVVDATTDAKVNIQYTIGNTDPVCIKQDDSIPCDQGANGWQYAKNPDGTPNYAKIVICGAACDTIKNNSPMKVDVLVGCDTLK